MYRIGDQWYIGESNKDIDEHNRFIKLEEQHNQLLKQRIEKHRKEFEILQKQHNQYLENLRASGKSEEEIRSIVRQNIRRGQAKIQGQ